MQVWFLIDDFETRRCYWEQSKLERSGINSSNLRFLLLDHHLPGSGWAELCQCSVQFTDCAVGPGGLKSSKQWWREEETRPETQTRAQCLMVLYFLRWRSTSVLPWPGTGPASVPSSSHLSRPGSVTATKIKQVFSYWSDPHHPASHCTDSSPLCPGLPLVHLEPGLRPGPMAAGVTL